MKLAEYLFSRLRQLGVESVHGVPGDYNLTLLDYVEPMNLRWVGNANELNAAYAADGYARIKGLGALVTTFGVGELSAINAIAGAFAERAAVVHIVGIPARASKESRALIHHTLNDGEYGHFAELVKPFTVAQTRLWDPRTSTQQIDDTLRQCLIHSRPVYIEFPVDLVPAAVPDDRLATPIEVQPDVADEAVEKATRRISDMMGSAKQPIIFVDGEVRAMGIVDEVQAIVEGTRWPTWTTPFGKGLLDETKANFHGVYKGKFDETAVQEFVNGADLVLYFGPHLSSTNTSAFTSIPKADATIWVTDTQVKLGTEILRDVPAKIITTQLAKGIDRSRIKEYSPYPDLPRDYRLSFSDVSTNEPLKQDKLWRVLSNFIQPGDIIMGETGTSGYGVREMPLPQHTRLFTPVTWLSIGYMLPAAQGAALAQKELMASSKYFGMANARTVLFIGDGSFQMTVQELATIIRLELNVVIFLLNNDGYTIERVIHGRKQKYNDIGRWNYLQAPSFFGAKPDTYTRSVQTWAELEEVLSNDQVANGKELRMVEMVTDREDAPQGPLAYMLGAQKAAESSAGN
ncbi:thiamine pyrophosphate enzyme [Xylariaceae sp. FL0016]|nr:thiamine pyrophosphate enzyme [Xylariaceae sp. FL0016]